VQALKDRILKDGRNLGDGILKVDSILNHQMDPCLIKEMGEEIARRFRHLEPTRVLTAEVSGIAPALMTALALNVPVVYARKKKPITMYGPVLLETAPTHTKGGHEVMLLVSAEFMPLGERVLIVDDFLATGHTLRALARIVRGGGCTLVGIAAVIEKSFEGGRALLESRYQVPIESLVTITSMDDDKIELA
jgi:xanthine phosphoribosyltransferase